MTTTIPRASLLGLPAELRLKIYDFTLLADVDCRVIDDIDHSKDSNGTHATLIPNPRADLALAIPWLNLLLTCRIISSELRSYLRESACLKHNENRTYVLDLKVLGSQVQKPRRTIIWRRIPCAPNEANCLVMNVSTRPEPGPWTEGGPASLARALHQVLNHTVHLGPRMVRDTLLEKHMELQDLLINVEIGSTCSSPAIGCDSDPKFNWGLFKGAWTKVSRTGFLFGYFELIRLKNNENEEVEVRPQWQKVPSVPGHWRNYGYDWGIESLQCAGYFTL